MDSLDREFKEHLVFVFNQVIQLIRKGGWSPATVERSGRLLRRLYWVHCEYRRKKQRYTLPEWIEKLALVGKEMEGIFG